LIDLIKKRNYISPVLEPVKAVSRVFDSYDPANISEISLLFQTGYLTVKHEEDTSGPPLYTLGIPNEEVRVSLHEHLLNAYSNYPLEQIQQLMSDMRQQISGRDMSGLERNLRMLLANIPYRLHIKNEAYYHSLFLLIMKMLGFDIHGEQMTDTGRIDAVWSQPGLAVIVEIKYHANRRADRLLNDAMKQIHDRRYYEAYLDRKVTLMAVAFTGKDVKCRMDDLNI
jgi:hypothetical protein